MVPASWNGLATNRTQPRGIALPPTAVSSVRLGADSVAPGPSAGLGSPGTNGQRRGRGALIPMRRIRSGRFPAVVVLAAAGLVVEAGAARAATITVTTFADEFNA